MNEVPYEGGRGPDAGSEPGAEVTPQPDAQLEPVSEAPSGPTEETQLESVGGAQGDPLMSEAQEAEPEAAPSPADAQEVAPPSEAAPSPADAQEAAPPPEAAPPAAAVQEAAPPPEAGGSTTEATQSSAPAVTGVPDGQDEVEELEDTPRVRPEIPGADLIPDIVPEGEEFLDAEARAAAEAEAAEAAARSEEEADDEPRPIANAAIDLAAGARYTSTGKRKTAVARVILKPGTGTYLINGKALEVFFPRETLQRMIRQPLESVGYEARMDVVARMHGGGVSAQAGALRHGISRALIVADPHLRGELKRRGFLTRDPRVKERKKAGLKKARKRPQFSKR